MSTSVPARIKIGPTRYRVRLNKNRCNGDFGFMDERTAEIGIDPTTAKDQQRDTLLHEVLHAIVAMTGVCKTDVLPEENEEVVVTQISPILLDVLRSNSKLCEFLLGKDE